MYIRLISLLLRTNVHVLQSFPRRNNYLDFFKMWMASNLGYHLFYFTSSYCWQSERTKCPWIATFGAWVLAQNGACVYTLTTQYVSVYIIYSLSPCQTPFWNASLAGSTEQWIVLELATMMRTQGPGAHFSSARVRRRLLLLAYKVFGPTAWIQACPVSTVLEHRAWAPSVYAT